MRLMKKKSRLLVFLVLGVSLASATFNDSTSRLFDIAKNLDIYATVFKELNKFYVDEVDPKKAMETAVDALLKSFDPYTVFYAEDKLDDFLLMTTGKYQGIGIQLTEINRQYHITFIDAESPAEKSGLRIGDQLIAINNIRVTETPETDPAHLLKSAATAPLLIEIQRPGEAQTQKISLARAIVQIKNVSFSGILQPGIGYIQLEEFNASAAKEMKSALVSLKQQGMKSLILDIRNNPGGLLTQAIDICNLFLPKGTKIVETRGKIEEWNKSYEGLNASFDTETPIVVLINKNAASAAEIVAGVLQDYDRAVILGQKSYGKGLVQVTRDLPFHTKIKITTARYYTPSGRCIQAIQYKNGSAIVNADSSIHTFLTKNGRKVVDGGGITPDQVLTKTQQSGFVLSLLKQYKFYLYALNYRINNPKIAPAAQFTLTDLDVANFEMWLTQQKFQYENAIQSQVKSLLTATEKNPAYAALHQTLVETQATEKQILHQDMLANKEEIKHLLAQEIILHTYLQKGVNLWSNVHDPAINAGIKLLQNPTNYRTILTTK
jgi:carboxyl-terminal processing protease